MADKYDALAAEGDVTSADELMAATGFGGMESCTLCAPVFGSTYEFLRELCRVCIHETDPTIKHFPCTRHPTYDRLDRREFNPDDLRALAGDRKKVVREAALKNKNFKK